MRVKLRWALFNAANMVLNDLGLWDNATSKACWDLEYAHGHMGSRACLGKSFQHHRGLWQGCTVSPIMFVLAMEPFQCNLHKATDEGILSQFEQWSASIVYADNAHGEGWAKERQQIISAGFCHLFAESGSRQKRHNQLPACHFAESHSRQRSVLRQLFTPFLLILTAIIYIQYINKHFKSECLTTNSHNHYIK